MGLCSHFDWLSPFLKSSSLETIIKKVTTALNALHIPRKVVAASAIESDLPLLQYKTEIKGKTAIYVCYNKTCKLPVTDLDEALTQISSE